MQNDWLALAIGCALLIAGAYALRKLNVSVISRVLMGATMLGAGIALIYPLIDRIDDLNDHQVRFGFAIALLGLGINQLTAPIRLAFKRPV